MTNQQKIEFYLSKGFAVEVEWDDKEKAKIYHIDSNGNMLAVDNKGMANIFESCFFASIKSITPIIPKPYEFKVGEMVEVLSGKLKGRTGKIYEIFKDVCRIDLLKPNEMGELTGFYWYELAPALPEDEVEVVEVERCNVAGKLNDEYYWIFTKPDGKKLKIRVIKQ